jgi:single-strand DNA-binding protein
VCFGKDAQTAGEHLHKGEQVLVEGRLDVRQYEGKDGVKKTAVEVIVNRITLLPNGPRAVAGGYVAPPPAGEASFDSDPSDPNGDLPF